MYLAHGIGGRADLPVPLWLALYAAGIAVLISFFAVMAFWTEPKLRGAAAGRPLPGPVERIADSPVTRAVLRSLGLLAAIAVLVVARFGSNNSADNPASTWFYVWLWVGLPVASAVLGPVWRLVNPLRTIASAFGTVVRPRELPAQVGYWPAAVTLLAFTWLELVYDHADVPRVVFGFLVGYGLVHTIGGIVFGQRWFDRGDGFEVYSTLIGHLAPLGRRSDGRLVLRNPLDGLAALRPAPGLVATICVLLGSTGFDGFSRSQAWRDLIGTPTRPVHLLLGTVGLLTAIGLVAATYTTANRVSTRYLPPQRAIAIEARFVHSLVPIALGYVVAHYFSFAVFQGQAGYLLAGDPLARGWHLFGLAAHHIDYTVVTPPVIALVQVVAIVAGHVLGVVSAHDRAVGTFARRYVRRGQYGLLTTMVAYTVGGIALVLGS